MKIWGKLKRKEKSCDVLFYFPKFAFSGLKSEFERLGSAEEGVHGEEPKVHLMGS